MSDAKTFRLFSENTFSSGTMMSADMTIEQVAARVAEFTVDFGKPVVENKTRVNDGLPVAVFTFNEGSLENGRRIVVIGVTVEQVRAAYRAARNAAIETCGRCGGSGTYYGAGVIENGVFKGYTGVCFRCKGKGTCTHYANELGNRGMGDAAARAVAADIRAAERNAQRGPDSGDNHNDSRGDVALCRNCAIEISPGTIGGLCSECAPHRGSGPSRDGCPDCGNDKLIAMRWCEACSKARLVQPARGRAYFYSGPRENLAYATV